VTKSWRIAPLLMLILALAALVAAPAPAQEAEPQAEQDPNVTFDPELLNGLEYRSTNFTRGGRSPTSPATPAAACGRPPTPA
jgi:hypothetical protein